jgi:hypothetical protein
MHVSMGSPIVIENCGQDIFDNCWGAANSNGVNLGTPVNGVHVVNAAGGTLGVGTYYYRVAAYNSATGEISTASAETSVVVSSGVANRIQVNWGAVTGPVTHYMIFGRTTGAEQLLYTITSNFLAVFDDGTVTPSGLPVQRNGFSVVLCSTDQATNTGASGVARYHLFNFCEMTFWARASQLGGGSSSFGNMIFGVSNGDANTSPVVIETPNGGALTPTISWLDTGTQTQAPTVHYGKVDATVSHLVNGVQVVGARSTGWTAASGVAGNKGAFVAAVAGAASAGYVQAEANAALTRIAALEARVRALDDAIRTHGLTGT